MSVLKGQKIVVWFSCGAASAVAAKRTIEKYGDIAEIEVVNNFILEEHPDNRRFLRDIEKWIGQEIKQATNDKYPNGSCKEVWDDRAFMSGPNGAPCTIELKKVARRQLEERNHVDWHVLGFTTDEEHRHKGFILTERENLLPVLIDDGLSKIDCAVVLMKAGIKLPVVYDLGYPNANCIGCVKATSPTYWNHVRKINPDVFEDRREQSKRLGAKLVLVHPKKLEYCVQDSGGYWWNLKTMDCLTYIQKNGKKRTKSVRLFLDELDPDVKGAPLKGLDFECGIFCEEIR